MQNWSCHGCGDCCRIEAVITDLEKDRIEALDLANDPDVGPKPWFAPAGRGTKKWTLPVIYMGPGAFNLQVKPASNLPESPQSPPGDSDRSIVLQIESLLALVNGVPPDQAAALKDAARQKIEELTALLASAATETGHEPAPTETAQERALAETAYQFTPIETEIDFGAAETGMEARTQTSTQQSATT